MKHKIILLSILLLAACDSVETDSKTYPKGHEDARQAKRGKLTGEDGLDIFSSKKDDVKGGSGLGVNSFLWRASLDTLSFMPITSADPFGGTILTDWYEDPAAQGKAARERFKINVTILDDRLRSDGVKVSAFKQVLDENNAWKDAQVSKNTASDLENAILTRARQLRIAQTGK